MQERSSESVQRISDAASRLLAEGIPLETLTTSQIAAAAGVAVGTLYRFFPDKQAIVDALAVQRLGEFQQLMVACIVPQLNTADGPRLLGEIIDSFVAFLDANPDFRTIAYGGRHISQSTREQHSGMDAGGTVFVKRYMVDVLGMHDMAELEVRLRLVVEAGDRLLAFAFEQSDQTHRQKIIDEAKRMLSRYLFAPMP